MAPPADNNSSSPAQQPAGFLKALQQRWFLVALVLLIIGGLYFGAKFSQSSLPKTPSAGMKNLRMLVAGGILFLMSFTMDSSKLRASITAPAPVLGAILINILFIPLFTWLLVPLQTYADMRVGLLIMASVPSTMAAASIWTRKAGGNDAVSLLVTLVTNSCCFLFTPLWLKWTLGRNAEMNTKTLIEDLVFTALLPVLAGQFLRIFPLGARIGTTFKREFGTAAQVGILIFVYWAAFQNAGPRLAASTGQHKGLLFAVFVAWLCCVVIHLLALWAGWQLGRLIGWEREERIAVSFAGSQKTLPIGVQVATSSTFGPDFPFAMFPVLLYHASQLLLDNIVAERMIRTTTAAAKPSPQLTPVPSPSQSP